MIRPKLCRFITGTTACINKNAAVRLVSIVSRHSASFISSNLEPEAIAALFTRISRRPHRSTVSLTSARTVDASRMSPASGNALAPNSLTTGSARSGVRTLTPTCAPPATNRAAVARPKPRAAPVTTATRPENSPGMNLSRRHHRQLNKARLIRRVINPLRRFLKIFRLGPENIRHELLRIAIVKRKPTGLNLDHDAMTRQKDVICRRQRPAIKQRLIRLYWLWIIKAFAIPPAKDVHRNSELIPTEFRIRSSLVR